MEDYPHAFRRGKASAATLSKKISNANGNGLTPKTVYDDVFGGPPKFGVPTFSAPIEDYSEIFGSFHSSRGSSIPVLDLPVSDAGDFSLDVRASKFDYSEIFGGFNGIEFFDSHEELFGESKGGESSSEEAWTPAGTRSPSEGSSAGTLACSENNQFTSDGVAYHTFDGEQSDVSNYETPQRSEQNGTNDKTHSAQTHAVPGVTCVVDGSTSPQKTEIINTSLFGVNDIDGNVDYNRGILEEIFLKKTMSLPPMYGSITRTSESDFELQRRSHGNGSNSNNIFDGVKQSNDSNFETLQRSGENETHNAQPHAVSGVMFVVDGSMPPQKTEIINTSPCEVNDIGGNVDYNKGILEEKNLKKTMSLPQSHSVSGVTFVVDGSTSPQKTEIINTSPCGFNDIGGNGDYDRGILEEKNLKKTMSLPSMYGSLTKTSESDFELQRSHGVGSNSNNLFISISEISLRTQPSHVPPPMRPPPKLSIKQGKSKIASEKYGQECTAGDGSPAFFDVEVDANSSAAASAAAMKEAMEKAQARLKSAKELMERKRDGLHSRPKLGLKDDSSNKARKEDNKANHEALRFGANESQGASEREDIGMKGFGRQEGQKDIRTARVAPNFGGREKGLNVGKEFVEQKVTKEPRSAQSRIDKEAGEWRVEKQFYELATTEKSKAAFEVLEQAKNEKKLMTPIMIQKHEKSEKVAVKQVFQLREENGEKSKALKEACVQENRRILEAAKEACELKKPEKKLTVAQEMSQCKGNEKKLKMAQEMGELEEDENKLKVACELEEHGKTLQQAPEQKENEKNLEEARKWEETENRRRRASWSEVSERRLKDANEQVENGKKLKESCKREESENILKDFCQQEESVKKLKEACKVEFNERRLQDVHGMENDRRQKDDQEQEENEKQLKEAYDQEQEENEKRLQEAHLGEENEEKLKQAFEEEENERRLKEAHDLKENENRVKKVYKMEENEKQLKEVFELVDDVQRQREANEGGTTENRQKQACEQEENEVKVDREAHDINVDKNLMTASGSCQPFDDNNFEANQEDPKYEVNSGKLKLAQEAIEHEGSGGMTEAAKDACECEGNEKELKIAKAGKDEDESGRSRPADVTQCAPEQDRYEIKDPMVDLSLGGHENNLGESEIVIDLEPNEKNKRISRVASNQESLGKSQVANDQGAYQKSNEAAEGVKYCIENEKNIGLVQPIMLLVEKGNTQKIAQEVNKSQCTERKEKNYHEACSYVEIEKQERLQREKEQEEERQRKIEEEKEWERERERNRMAVERATREARERAFAEARERAERAAVGRATSEARQRAMAEAREKLEKASAEAREKSLAEKALMEARVRAGRAAVERATAEVRERAAEKAVLDARERAERSSECAERSVADKYSVTNSRDSGMRQSSSFSDLRDPRLQSSGSDSSSRYTNSSVHGVFLFHHEASNTSAKFQGTEGESAQRCKARLERHQRTVGRAAKALAEKNMRDLLVQREQAERNRLAETLDAEVRRWSSGKEGNLRALLSTLQYILGPDSGWQPIPLTEVITAVAVKKAYRKATLCVHPDKMQQKRASIQQKYICEKVFDLLKEAWNKFNSEER
ncbi:auxilin-like protein 1 isoform X2 [Macadamia integrifolia]|uniref:auxilin-like protein 1 isoform X2 n=1 Tax=Macadamia integrifolia TaxID=60698 RepID=UPI001C4FB4D1|nr:auxilin-like protein 1 isoform X2 [Macadamia integrifolia]